MSRSHRKSACCGITSASSEAADKHRLNRRLRHRNKIRIATGHEPLARNLLYDPWVMDKDGKRRFDPQSFPALMRK